MKPANLLAKLFERMRAIGMGERVLKTTLAVILAWEIGLRLPGGTEHPYFAPLGALLSFQVTIADSITAAFQRVIGIVAGVVVALVVSRITGQTALGAGLLVFLALVVGTNLRLTQQGVAQVATSALIVMIVGGADSFGYAGARILESIVGAVIGVSVNALLVPPTFLPSARQSTRGLADAIGRTLDELATIVTSGLTAESAAEVLTHARDLATPYNAARAELDKAENSLKYNVLRRSQQAQLALYRYDLKALDHTVLQVRSIARTLADAADPAGGRSGLLQPTTLSALGGLLAALAEAVRSVTDNEVPDRGAAAMQQALENIEERRREVAQAAATQSPALTSDAWMHLGAILAIADRMRTDLSRSAEAATAVSELAEV